jgi:uncharacterized membrane protein
MKKITELFSRYKHIIFLLLVIFLAVKPLIHLGLPPTHDGEYHVIRFYEFDKAIRDGDWYPRWAEDLNNGYGIPLFNYVYPLPNYAASLFHLFGSNFIDAFKMNLILATAIGVIFFYLWTRLYFNNLAALTAAVFYCFAPYRFVDIYVRGSVGEVWALAWFPAFLWAITIFIQKKKMDYFVLSGIFFALTIFSHNIVGLMFAAFAFTYVLFCLFINKSGKKIVIFTFGSFLLGLCLSAIFWLPALVETKFVKNLQLYNIDEHFPELSELLIPSWGTGFSNGALGNQMSFQIGVANLIAVFLGFIFFIRSKYAFFLSWFLLVLFLMLGLSKPLWHTMPLLNYFQFPWRFLSLAILLCSFIAGAVVNKIVDKKWKIIVCFLFIFLSIILSIPYTKPAYYHYRTDSHYLTRDNFFRGTNSQGDLFNTIWIDKKLPIKEKRIEISQGEGLIKLQESKTTFLKYEIIAKTKSEIIANIAYFPGWTLDIDGKKSQLQRTRDGIMTFSVPKGKHVVSLQLNDTIIRRIGGLFSFLGFITCIVLISMRKRLNNL